MPCEYAEALTLNPAVPERLLFWYGNNARVLPWRTDTDPYRVWISEIMLQQTRVETVIPYYERFLKEIPSIRALRETSDDKLLKLWEGLGYYSRARNLRKAAEILCVKYGGAFPHRYEDILGLPGIGPYTAGAIASICFGLPVPAVDGNVLRVFARLLKIATPIDGPDVPKQIRTMLSDIYAALDSSRRGAFTQALMELGACVCVPNGAPLCTTCPVAEFCMALQDGIPEDFPVRTAKKEKRNEDRTILILKCGDRFAVRRRPDKGLLASLWELPNVSERLTKKSSLAYVAKWGLSATAIAPGVSYTHVFTHIRWRIRSYRIDCAEFPSGNAALDLHARDENVAHDLNAGNRNEVLAVHAKGANDALSVRDADSANELIWATAEELTDVYALPTAFRKAIEI
jgi:A/G-specific adenine glycosylase